MVLTSSIWCVLDLGALTLSKDMGLLSEKDTNTATDMDKGPVYIYAASKVCSTEATPLHDLITIGKQQLHIMVCLLLSRQPAML